MPTTTEIAQGWKDQGVCPIPVLFKGKRPRVPWKDWVGKLPPDVLLKAWFKQKSNLAMIMANGFTIADFDDVRSYVTWKAHNPAAAQTWTVKSNRGFHAYFWLKESMQKTFRMEGGELKATGLMCAPPSVHASGKYYTVVNEAPILTLDNAAEIGVRLLEEERAEQAEDFYMEPSCSAHEGETPIARIKNNISILAYLCRYTKPIRASERTWIAKCPFHDDHTPSLGIWPREDCCYCFSPKCVAHGKKNDVVNCAMYLHNMNVTDAVRMLARELEGYR